MSIHSETSREIRGRLSHPVVDADAHYLELAPVFNDYFVDYVRKVGGSTAIVDMAKRDGLFFEERVLGVWHQLTPEERHRQWRNRPGFWTLPGNTRDRATGYLPRLLNQRLDEFGLDYAVLYPSRALTMGAIPETELRQIAVRALNCYHAEIYAEFSDRMTPAAVIATQTPAEAISELEYVTRELKFKAAMLNGILHRAVPTGGTRIDTLAVDSEYDYEPLWGKLVELRIAPVFHSAGVGWGSRRSPSSYTFNHLGSFAASAEAICRSIFLGGVTRRHPELDFAFLEGGVGYACSLFADLLSHWEKRNAEAIRSLDPAELDLEALCKLLVEFGGSQVRGKLPAIEAWLATGEPTPQEPDEFRALEATCAEDLRDLFVPRFYFGCEADDPMVACAFDRRRNPMGVALGAMFGSDIGHWDVPSMASVLAEAHELVDRGHLDEEQFRAFAFENAVRFYGSLDPTFFDGTRVADEAGSVLAVG